MAAACRDALQEFLDGSAHWGKSGLALWLAGPYRLLTRFAPRVDSAVHESDVAPASSDALLESASVESIVEIARREILTTLRVVTPPQSNVSFAHTAVYAGAVARSRDAASALGWVPIDRARMRLADRVLSLAAVDYLMRPTDYLALLSVCKLCAAVSFDGTARAHGYCPVHMTTVRKIKVAR